VDESSVFACKQAKLVRWLIHVEILSAVYGKSGSIFRSLSLKDINYIEWTKIKVDSRVCTQCP